MKPARILFRLAGICAVAAMMPVSASACDFAYRSSVELYRQAQVIFVGKVLESPWVPGSNGRGAIFKNQYAAVRFSVQKQFRGAAVAELTLPDALQSTCDVAFLEGETYLVHGEIVNGALRAGQIWRPLVLSDAVEELKYLESAVNDRRQGVLWGFANVELKGGLRWTAASNDRLLVVAEKGSERFQVNVSTRPYELVLPPGDYRVWLELNGKVVRKPQLVNVANGRSTVHRLDGVGN